MKKNIIIIILSLITVILISSVVYLIDRNNAADAYIRELEHDFPEYIDTTSGGDAYSEYYK